MEMEEGNLWNHGMVWQKGGHKYSSLTKWLMQGMTLRAYRCSNCKVVQLRTDE